MSSEIPCSIQGSYKVLEIQNRTLLSVTFQLLSGNAICIFNTHQLLVNSLAEIQADCASYPIKDIVSSLPSFSTNFFASELARFSVPTKKLQQLSLKTCQFSLVRQILGQELIYKPKNFRSKCQEFSTCIIKFIWQNKILRIPGVLKLLFQPTKHIFYLFK